MQVSRDTYHVDPVVFLLIYLAAAPLFWYSLVRTVRAVAVGTRNDALRWATIFLCAVVAPFVYVLLFGRNLPWWVYGIIAVLVGQGTYSLAVKLRRTKAAGSHRG
jgi:fatty acid desaturase